jgi:hypothetical protein
VFNWAFILPTGKWRANGDRFFARGCRLPPSPGLAQHDLDTVFPRPRRTGARKPPQLHCAIKDLGVRMSRRAGERGSKGPVPVWPGPPPWSQLRPGDEFALTRAGATSQRFRVVALSLTDAAMAPPNAESSETVLTLVVGIVGEPLSARPARRLVVTAIAMTRR